MPEFTVNFPDGFFVEGPAGPPGERGPEGPPGAPGADADSAALIARIDALDLRVGSLEDGVVIDPPPDGNGNGGNGDDLIGTRVAPGTIDLRAFVAQHPDERHFIFDVPYPGLVCNTDGFLERVFTCTGDGLLDGLWMRTQAFAGSGRNLTFNNMEVTRYNGYKNRGSFADAREGEGWIFNDCHVFNSGEWALSPHNHMRVNRGLFEDMGRGGVGGARKEDIDHRTAPINDFIMDGLRVRRFNTDKHGTSGNTAGAKLERIRGAEGDSIIRNCIFEDGFGKGLWLDSGCEGVEITGNRAEYCGRGGIVIEICTGITLVGNYAHFNGWKQDDDLGGGQFFFRNANEFDLIDNFYSVAGEAQMAKARQVAALYGLTPVRDTGGYGDGIALVSTTNRRPLTDWNIHGNEGRWYGLIGSHGIRDGLGGGVGTWHSDRWLVPTQAKGEELKAVPGVGGTYQVV